MSEREAIREVEPEGWRFGRWRLAARWWQQWGEWLRGDWNWRNFAVIVMAYECGTYKGRYHELTLGLLGVNVEIELYDAVDRAGELSPIIRKLEDLRDGKEEWQQ